MTLSITQTGENQTYHFDLSRLHSKSFYLDGTVISR